MISYSWLIKMFSDWIILTILGIILKFMVIDGKIMTRYEQCLPGYTKNSKGDFICGDTRNPAWGFPYIPLSVDAGESFLIAIAPFIFLFVFNLIFWIIPLLRNKYLKIKPKENHQINTNPLLWFEVVFRAIGYASGMTTLFVHIIKFALGTPRPNAYTLKDMGDHRAMVSFMSGHTAIGFTNCWLFGLWCQKAINYSIKKNYRLIKSKIEEEPEYFTGNHWFMLPLWNLLKYMPTISMLIAWSPLIGASYIGVTRIREFWHTDIDCVAGALVGIGCAYYCSYVRFYNEIYGVYQKKKEIRKQDIEV